ncbi:RNA-dependent RNA polymerase family protein [Marinobacter shengliensis]
MADFDNKAFWTVLPFDVVAPYLNNLRVSPLGCVPQRDRRPRLINDLTFYGVNAATARIAPSESMQFGRTLQRLLRHILMADPRHGPVYVIKVDVADGFYRIPLDVLDAPALAVVLPLVDDEPPLVAIPLDLPTEMVADLSNARKDQRPHRLDDVANTVGRTPQVTPPSFNRGGTPPYPLLPFAPLPKPGKSLHAHDLVARPRRRLAYVDDFISLVQGSPGFRQNFRRTLFHAIDQVLAPLDSDAYPQHNEPISVKKLLRGNGNWTTAKVVLGWLLDTVEKTIRLPEHRVKRLVTILNSLQGASGLVCPSGTRCWASSALWL